MINPDSFIKLLLNLGVEFFTGVPDSLLKSFCAYVTDNCGRNHVIAANEGGAIALAAGHYLVIGRPALVYMQNSGQGNAVNPLCSLADPDVYSIPMVLLVGWRGELGVKDEPQHVKHGLITMEEQANQHPPEYFDDFPKKPNFILFRVAKGARKDLGRPKEQPQVNKALFMETLSR